MKNFLIGIGGTGAKCIEHLVHSCSAGLGPDQVWVGMVDQDEANGNVNKTKILLSKYQNLRNSLRDEGRNDLSSASNLFNTNITTNNDSVWLPLKGADPSLEQVVLYDKKAKTAEFFYILFSVFITVGSIILPALLSKIYTAKIKKKKYLELWGTGKPKRELMFVDDLADACIFFLNKKTKETLINIGSGNEMKIIDYAKLVIKILKTDLKIKFDSSKPDGTPRKIVDIKIAKKYGWSPKISFEKGLKLTYQDFLESI